MTRSIGVMMRAMRNLSPRDIDMPMTHDVPAVAFEITSDGGVDVAQSCLLGLAAQLDACGSASMAQHARRVAAEIKAAAEPARGMDQAVGSPPVTPKISPVM